MVVVVVVVTIHLFARSYGGPYLGKEKKEVVRHSSEQITIWSDRSVIRLISGDDYADIDGFLRGRQLLFRGTRGEKKCFLKF